MALQIFYCQLLYGTSSEMSEMAQMTSLLTVNKCIKRASKNKLLSKILLAFVRKFILKQLDISLSFSMNYSQLDCASLTISAHRKLGLVV